MRDIISAPVDLLHGEASDRPSVQLVPIMMKMIRSELVALDALDFDHLLDCHDLRWAIYLNEIDEVSKCKLTHPIPLVNCIVSG